MSVQAFILIQTEVGKATGVADAVAKIPGVTLSEGVTGPYDVIMRAESASMEELVAWFSQRSRQYPELHAHLPAQLHT